MQSNDNSLLIMLALGALLWFQSQHPQPAPLPTPVDPTNPLAVFRGKPGAAAVGKAHRDYAAVVNRPSAIYTSSGKLKADLVRFHDVLYASTSAANTLPGFGAAFDAAFVKSFGEQDAAIDDAKAAAFLDSAAAALGG